MMGLPPNQPQALRRGTGVVVALPALAALAALAVAAGCGPGPDAGTHDLLLRGGTVYDGTGAPPRILDVGVTGDRVSFVGPSERGGAEARDTVEVTGLMVVPGFIDMHSHAELDEEYGRDGLPFLYQGVTTAVLGVDGGGTPDVAERLAAWSRHGIGLNALTYVGHGDVRGRVLGSEARAPTQAELDRMRSLVRAAMEAGAFGLSSGLFYTPGYFAETEEVIELARVAAEFGGIYDTHDRDLGASYQGIGYLPSIREGIRIGEESGARVIFSHFNAQGARNYGRAPEGAALIEEARARGVEVWAAQHVYTATQSNLRAYAIPRWAAAGGDSAMLRRFDHPDTARMLDRITLEMLDIRGGAEKILFADPRPHLNGRTLAEVASERASTVPETVRWILSERNAAVMNLDLYDSDNTRFLARQPWMMTCTDGRTPAPGQTITHPRPFGAFTRKLRLYVIDEPVLPMEFAIRSMTGLAADFLGLDDRGYVRVGAAADLAVLDSAGIRDLATFAEPQRLSEGTEHVLVNGRFALRDGRATGALAGVPIRRPRVTDSRR